MRWISPPFALATTLVIGAWWPTIASADEEEYEDSEQAEAWNDGQAAVADEPVEESGGHEVFVSEPAPGDDASAAIDEGEASCAQWDRVEDLDLWPEHCLETEIVDELDDIYADGFEPEEEYPIEDLYEAFLNELKDEANNDTSEGTSYDSFAAEFREIGTTVEQVLQEALEEVDALASQRHFDPFAESQSAVALGLTAREPQLGMSARRGNGRAQTLLSVRGVTASFSDRIGRAR